MTGVPLRDVPYHRCAGKQAGVTPRCPSRSVRAEILETFVWEQLVRMLRDPKRALAEEPARSGRRTTRRPNPTSSTNGCGQTRLDFTRPAGVSTGGV